MPQHNEKTFKHFPELLPELRRLVISQMSPDDRCRLTRSASWVKKEVIDSNYCHTVNVSEWYSRDSNMTIHVLFEEYEYGKENYFGYILEFVEKEKEKYMKYCKHNESQQEIWRCQLPRTTKLDDDVRFHLKNILKKYQKGIKHLEMYDKWTAEQVTDLEISSMPRLAVLKGAEGILPLVSKIKRPLKSLTLYGEFSPCQMTQLLSNDQIFRVSDYLSLPALDIKLEDFERFAAEFVFVSTSVSTEEDVVNFIKLWQNGKLKKKFKHYQFCYNESTFDPEKFFNLLGTNNYYKIVHHNLLPISSRIWMDSGMIGFVVSKRRLGDDEFDMCKWTAM